MSTGELACTYAALILHEEGIPVTAEKIAALVKAANVVVEPYWPGLFAKLCHKRDIGELIMNVGSAGAVVAVEVPVSDAPGGAAAAAVEPAAEAAKEESDGEEYLMIDLFG